MERKIKIGSLFDGSGGFPLSGSMCGFEPVWAAEVEPYPIAVTKSRFPNMKHLGSVADIHGGKIEPVDVVTFGSPCQDLSIAGKRAGLKHENNGDDETTRSGLFMEAVRIIKEMREATNGVCPAFAVFENVCGAFSSNQGEDFRTVLEELIKIVEPQAVMPEVPAAGWAYADCYIGDGWSLAYRVFDAQYWGVPQRRRRIYLVADFRGECAQKVLFEREGVRGYFAQGRTPWQGIAADAEDRSGTNDREGEGNCLNPWDYQSKRVFNPDGIFPTLQSGERSGQNQQSVLIPYTLRYDGSPQPDNGNGANIVVQEVYTVFEPCSMRDENWAESQVKNALRAGASKSSHAVVETLAFDTTQVTSPQNGSNPQWGDPCHPLAAQGHAPTVICKCQHLYENHSQDTRYKGPLEVSPMLPAQLGTGGNNTPFVVEETPVYCLQGNGIDRADTAGCNGKGVKEDICYTLNTIDRPAVAYLASGKNSVGTLMANAGTKLWLGNQEAFSGDYSIIEERMYAAPILYPTDEDVLEFVADNNADAPHQQDLLQTPESVARTLACGTHAAGSHLTKTVINYGVRYIVRRLTPTECARLQGFPDRWGHPDIKEDFSEEEYAFWLGVRNTHAAINGKGVKDYTKSQMLAWYNKLHTDSSEYKMWGNGIALPCALYVMEGIEDAIRNTSEHNTPDHSESNCTVLNQTESSDATRNGAVQSVMKQLKLHRNKLSRQQIKTIRGQVLRGDLDGAKKGIARLIGREGG